LIGDYDAAMCTRYVSPEQADMERFWNLRPGQAWRQAEIFPRRPGPFIRALRTGDDERELVIGQWGLVPWFARTPTLRYSTHNARYEEITSKASFKQSWAAGRRCIIPAWSFDEPNWESGRNVWWRFRRRDGLPWGLAGLWNTWTDKSTGEIVESYTMLTLNADRHPLMARMHKPDPGVGSDQQDKRSVVSIETTDVDQWLFGTLEQAKDLMRLPALELIEAGPANEPEQYAG
jgi:putative SOS response-associated peptidase YedK